MLADRIRAVGFVSASVLGIAGLIAVLDSGDVVQPAPVTVAMAKEPVDTPIREVQFVKPPTRERTVFCRYQLSRLVTSEPQPMPSYDSRRLADRF
jgi:hypothetical protein